MDAIELRMGEMRRYIITMIDEHSDYVLALAVPSLNSDIVNHFFSRAARLFPVGISQISARSSQITGKSSWEALTKRCRKPPSNTSGPIPTRQK